jgi:hypothetical protein
MTRSTYNREEEEFMNTVNGGMWIVKHSHGHRGENIEVYNDVQLLKEKLRKDKELAKPPAFSYDKINFVNKRSLIVQKYIENPLLIEGKKLDMRYYLYVASFNPIYAVCYPGYIRRSILNYSTNDTNIASHITN